MTKSPRTARTMRRALPGALVLSALLTGLACDDDDDASIRLVGEIHNMGCWALTSGQQNYELLDLPQEFRQDSLVVIVRGQLRNDVASVCMVGPALEIRDIEAAVP